MDEPRVDLHLLRLFAAVGEELHFGRAARRLGMAQPPLSQQIRKLEAMLGFRLFERTSRRVALSEAGAAFLEATHRVFAELGRGMEAARLIAEGREGTLDVGYVVPAMLGLLPGLVRRFRRGSPGVVLRLHELSTTPQLQALDAGRLDAAFVSGACGDPGLRQRLTWSEGAVAVLPASHPLRARSQVALAELAGEPFVSFPRGQAPALHDRWLAACLDAGFSPNVVQEAQSWQTISTLVGGELGVAVAPASVRGFATPGVVCVPLGAPEMSFQTSLCTRADASGPSLARFIAAALAEADELGLALERAG